MNWAEPLRNHKVHSISVGILTNVDIHQPLKTIGILTNSHPIFVIY